MPIQIIDGFKLGTSKPIDDRIVGSGSTFRDNITYKYDGLLVVDTKNHTPYVWNQDSATWSSIIQTSSTNVSGTYESIKEITSNSIKYVYVGSTTTSANDKKINITGGLKSDYFHGNGNSITDINPANISPGSNGQVLQIGSGGKPAWTTISSPKVTIASTETNKKYYIGFIDSTPTSGDLSNIYHSKSIYLDNSGVLNTKNLIVDGITTLNDNLIATGKTTTLGGTLTVSGAATFSRVAITDLNVSGAATFSRVAITDLNVSGAATFSRVFITGLSASTATFSRVDITDLNVSGAGTFSRVAITDLNVSRAATFSRVAITDLNVSGSATFSRVDITDLNVSRAGTFSRVAITDLNVSRAATFSRVAITDLNVSGSATFSGNLSVIGNIFNRWKITFGPSVATYWLKPNGGNQTTLNSHGTDNIFKASLHDIILYIYAATAGRSYDILIYMELTANDVYSNVAPVASYPGSNYYYNINTLSAIPSQIIGTPITLTPDLSIDTTNKFILLTRFNNNDSGAPSLSCIIPARRRFLIKVETTNTTSGGTTAITFTAMKFGR